ncbi:hypothetical protein GIB67_041613 [Kingdonia uniflora]|uniref:Uncharacterized protein n=1 Tax=Kingdonia uniflora TaxID=39325 RepID=A0A7J7MQV1_9MAGN|nr:hypothetical protein GIB67_041613 [Kingdonia uniflora]
MVKTRSQRAVEARALNDLRLAFKIDKIREAVFGQQGYDAVLLETRANYEGKTDVERGKEMNSVVGDEEDTVAELVEWPRLKGSRVEYPTGSSQFREFCKAKSSIDGIWGHASGYRGNFFRSYSVSQGRDYLYLLPDLAKEKKYRRLGDKLNYNFWEVILVCETLNERWAASGSKRRITAKDFLEYYAVKYVTATDGAYLSSSSSRPCFFELSSAGRVWNDNLLWVSGECFQRSNEEPLELNNRTITKGISCKVSRKESFIYAVSREGTELEAVLKELEISRFKRVSSKDNKVRRSQAKRRMARKTLGTMEEKFLTPELNTPLNLARLNEIPDGPVDMATVSSTIVRNLAKKKAVKRGAASRSVTSDNVDGSSKRRKVTSPTKSQVVLEESDKIAEGADLWPRFKVEAGLLEEQCRAKSREKMVAVVDDEFKKLELEKESEAAALKLKEVRDESIAEAERLVTASEKVEEMEDGLNIAEKTAADNQETIDLEIESSRLRVVDLEGLLEVKKKFSAELQSVLRPKLVSWSVGQGGIGCLELAGVCSARLSLCFCQSVSQLEAKSQVEDMTATIVSRDLALNQLTSELAELKEKAELAKYRIRALNDEISDMKCNIRALNELDRLKADLRRLKGREAQSRADLAEVQAKNKSLMDDLAHARRNVRRVVQRDKEMNERINQLCARIFVLERELRVRELKYEKDLKFELDKRDGEITSGEGSREMKEFLRRKEELVKNMRIDLTNYR